MRERERALSSNTRTRCEIRGVGDNGHCFSTSGLVPERLQGPQYHTRRKHGHIRHQQHSPTPGHHLYKKTQTNTSKSLFSFSRAKTKKQEEHTKKLRLKSERTSERGLQQTEENQNKTKPKRNSCNATRLELLANKTNCTHTRKWLRKSDAQRFKKALRWSFSWDIISFYKKKGKARRRQSARAYEKMKEKKCVKLTTGKINKIGRWLRWVKGFFFFFSSCDRLTTTKGAFIWGA